MTSFSVGRQAESAAVEYLKAHGYTVLEQNFRTRWCEIDIVAQKQQEYYFVEVKYRSSDAQGSGLEYITPAKLRQMAFAAEFWLQAKNKTGAPYVLTGVEVSGQDYAVTEFIESLT